MEKVSFILHFDDISLDDFVKDLIRQLILKFIFRFKLRIDNS